ncbi:hypothetical protein [Paenibacillus sp. MBLB4367]|uniref:hypothetical protein n=1 Tax=Paenibacillus sp. MBLB4367 TaxID=3384767 RepID=UPI003908409E
MIGNYRWNATVGLFGFAMTFLLSLGNNSLPTTLLRSVYSFALLFVAVFAFRWVLGTVAGFSNPAQQGFPHRVDTPGESHTGTKFDMSTPDDDAHIHEMLKGNMHPGQDDSSFSPLKPPKLVTKSNTDSEEMAKALRHMSEE